MMRYHSGMPSLRATLGTLLFATALVGAAPPETRNVIIVTADGLRRQEIFGGIDPVLMNQKEAGMADAAALRKQLWRETPQQRRALLMPFFWSTPATKGVLLGNLAKKSSVKVTNAYRVSYPGYSEILTGRAQDEAIRGNDAVQNPTRTVLEFLRAKLNLSREQVALFGSWSMFSFIGESRPGTILINAGKSELNIPILTPRLRMLNDLQFRMLMGDDSMRHDYVTFEMAFEYLKTAKPRVMHIAVGETDDWAHEKNYPRVLDMISQTDGYLRRLWNFLESSPDYRGSTLLVLTADHGRGATINDWNSHGSDVVGADQIWACFIGPGIPATGEASDTAEVHQRDFAPTILEQLGIDYTEYAGVKGKPIAFTRLQASAAAR